jgi:hypothetical protein
MGKQVPVKAGAAAAVTIGLAIEQQMVGDFFKGLGA